MLLQRTLFAHLDPAVPRDLYATGGDRSRVAVTVQAGELVDTDTYFGRFPASWWQRWTDVRAVTVSLDVDGEVAVEVCAGDWAGREQVVRSATASGAWSAVVPLDRFADGGALWLRLRAQSPSTVSSVRWSAEGGSVRRVALAMCTFDRADSANATLTSLAADPAVVERVSSVYVVDQGTDLVSSRPEFAQTAAVLGDRLRVLRQGNLGGSGGFARGMYEATRDGDEVDVVVMDDDIRLEPESLLRLIAFSAFAARRVLVGAQMLSMAEPTRLHLSAERPAIANMQAGVPSPGALVGVDVTVESQDRYVDSGWNGWWTCLIPGEAITAAGLPLPFFLQWDDIEFGVRARGSGFPTVTLPGAGVWHEDFRLKDRDSWSRYFAVRNGLVVGALHAGLDGKHYARLIATDLARTVAAMQYGLAATKLRALEDFLSGPSCLSDGGTSRLGELAALRSEYPDSAVVPAVEVAGRHVDVVPAGPEPSALDRVLAKRLVQQALGRVDPRPVSIPAHDAQWWHVARFGDAAVTDAGQGGVHRRRRDRAAAVELGRRAAALCLELRRRAPELRSEYLAARDDLTSRANWERLFGFGG
ncbi:glycosyltransferase [Tsukamurella sp. 8F]|uniref:glycosyltransferase n=1 Tax=unclassified Tsukamurella TaxID=2633480 RepID=UPI0023B8BA1E|nr:MULTISPECIES: glycosyltransferase [unclassified Tsukamurella]MDF0531805.1 glycosyltransferase [Tsukamurella sp. 8J]MDF0589047.1 glycosyltransferase [Tsukamurella sp. 8F]